MKKDVDENEPWLSVGIQKQRRIPCDTIHGKDTLWSSDQHMKKLMSLREGLQVMMQCYMRQHFFLIVIGFMNIPESAHRGETLR